MSNHQQQPATELKDEHILVATPARPRKNIIQQQVIYSVPYEADVMTEHIIDAVF
jgi:hypothetical protein